MSIISPTHIDANNDMIRQRIEFSDRVLIVAELTNNHLGDIDRLRAMVSATKNAGADIIKIQKRDIASFYPKRTLAEPYRSPFGNTFGEYRQGVELGEEAIDALCRECVAQEIPWYASVLDWPSFQFLQRYRPVALKIPSTISHHTAYHERLCGAFDGTVVLSTGATDHTYEAYVLERFKRMERLFLLQCTSAYPAPPDTCHIAVVRHYAELSIDYPNLIPGYSSHDSGSLASQLAIAAGARMVEKHVRLGNVDWVHFDHVALDLANCEFSGYVGDLRTAEQLCGQRIKFVDHRETHKYHPHSGQSLHFEGSPDA